MAQRQLAIHKLVLVRRFANHDSEPCMLLDGLYVGEISLHKPSCPILGLPPCIISILLPQQSHLPLGQVRGGVQSFRAPLWACRLTGGSAQSGGAAEARGDPCA